MDKLYLGVARENITPKVGCELFGYFMDFFSDSLHDDLTATAFYFRQGDKQALLVSLTVCSLHTGMMNDLRQTMQERFGIPNCIFAATHTHSGPNTCGQTGWGDIDTDYCDNIFIPGILAATEKAIANAKPVKMAVAQGNSLAAINRRQIDKDGKAILGQNPDAPFDPCMTVISFMAEDRIVANIIHYGMHGTAAGANHAISRDWSGLMTDALEEKTGAITAFFNGPEGDIGPRLSNGRTTGGGDYAYVYEIGGVAARDALAISEKLDNYAEAELAVSSKKLPLPLQKRMPLEEAKELIKQYEGPQGNVWGLTKQHLEDTIASYAQGFVDEEFCYVEQTLIAVGNVVFAAFPFELFTQPGLDVRAALPEKHILCLSNANGSEGYFITEDAIPHGGYEVEMYMHGHLQPCVNDASLYLAAETVKHIQENL